MKTHSSRSIHGAAAVAGGRLPLSVDAQRAAVESYAAFRDVLAMRRIHPPVKGVEDPLAAVVIDPVLPAEFRLFLEGERAMLMAPEKPVMGGVMDRVRAAMATVLKRDVQPAHLAAALPCVTWPSPATAMPDTIVATRFQPDGLQLRAPDGPGLGVELDWDKVEKYTVEL